MALSEQAWIAVWSILTAAALLLESSTLTVTASSVNPAPTFPALVAFMLLAYVLGNRNRKGSLAARVKAAPVYCGAALLLAAIVLAGTAFAHVANTLSVSRSFYGVLTVFPQNMDDPSRAAYCERHGRIIHGCQLRAEDDRRTPTQYYGPASGVGLAIAFTPARQPRPFTQCSGSELSGSGLALLPPMASRVTLFASMKSIRTSFALPMTGDISAS